MSITVSMNRLKDVDSFLDLLQRERHILVEDKDHVAFHCLSPAEYNLLKDEAAKSLLLSMILLAEEEIESDKCGSPEKAFEQFAQALEESIADETRKLIKQKPVWE